MDAEPDAVKFEDTHESTVERDFLRAAVGVLRHEQVAVGQETHTPREVELANRPP
jgi:hypothetical protein